MTGNKYKQESPLYENSGKVPFSSKISLHIRRKIFNFFIKIYNPGSDTKVLDVGVTSDDTFIESNFFEKFYPYKNNITCVGTENGIFLEDKFKGIKYIQVKTGENLPFTDKEFDIVFSNAVVEHTGNKEQQSFFIGELCRVARLFFITTPNRWFPVETHTGIPLLHYLPKEKFRSIIRGTKYDYWSYENNLNLLSAKEFREIFPADSRVNINIKKVKLLGITSNLIGYNI